MLRGLKEEHPPSMKIGEAIIGQTASEIGLVKEAPAPKGEKNSE